MTQPMATHRSNVLPLPEDRQKNDKVSHHLESAFEAAQNGAVKEWTKCEVFQNLTHTKLEGTSSQNGGRHGVESAQRKQLDQGMAVHATIVFKWDDC